MATTGGVWDWLDGKAEGGNTSDRLSPVAISALAYMAGVKDKSDRVIAVAIALAESGGNVKATHQNTDAHRSIDYGLWQINGYWHGKDYTVAELLTAEGNARAMAEISKNGTDWSAWATFANGNYKKHLDDAEAGAQAEVSIADGAQVAGEAIANAFTLDNLMALVLAGVFAAGALALAVVGLSKITGVDPTKAVAGASTAATVATLVA